MAKGIGQFSEEIGTSSLSAVAIPSYCRGLDLHVVAPPYQLDHAEQVTVHGAAVVHRDPLGEIQGTSDNYVDLPLLEVRNPQQILNVVIATFATLSLLEAFWFPDFRLRALP